MKKKLLVLALTSVTALSMADVSLYGKVAVGLEQDGFQNTTVPGTGSVQDFGSYFGIRGYDQVYGQTSAIWQVEQFLDLTSGQAYYMAAGRGMIVPRRPGDSQGRITMEVNTLASSESYLGLQGVWGRIRLGNLSNYIRSSMGAVDIYSYGNGVDGLGLYSRTSRILPTAIRYDSPVWGGFSFAAQYAFQTSGQTGVSGVGASSNFGGALNGFYSGGVYSLGMGWTMGNFSAKLGTMVFQNVGTYTTGTEGMNNPVAANYPNAAYSNAYTGRLELSYNDPYGLILGMGAQIANGLGWTGWANSGGSWNNFRTNNGYNYAGLTSNQYQTQEIGGSLGWHLGRWTPKVAYMYGNNMMYNGNITSVLAGSANQIPNSGYQQAVGELDWNITPRTIVFINYGQIWYGNTLQNITYCGSGCNNVTTINGSNQAFNNQSTGAIGFSHTF